MKRDARIGLAVVLVLGLMVTLLVARALHNRAGQVETEMTQERTDAPRTAEIQITGLTEMELGTPPEGLPPAPNDPRMQALQQFSQAHPAVPPGPMAEVVDLPEEPAPYSPAALEPPVVAHQTAPRHQTVAQNQTVLTQGAPLQPAPLAGSATVPIQPLPELGALAEAQVPAVPERLYVIEAGDNPWKIAVKVFGDGKHAQAIVDANPGLDPQRMKIGQELKLPNIAPRGPVAAAAPAPIQAQAPADEVRMAAAVYTIQAGDTLSDIAREHFGSGGPKNVAKILDANPGVDARKLKVGMTLKLPAQ